MRGCESKGACELEENGAKEKVLDDRWSYAFSFSFFQIIILYID